MTPRSASLAAAGVLTTLAVAHAQGSLVLDHRSRLFETRALEATSTVRATDLPTAASRGLLAYVIAGFTAQFGALDLSSGSFLPIGSGLPPDVGTGLVQGPKTSLLSLTFSGNLDAIDPFTGTASIVGPTGLRDCSTPGSFDPNCANVIGRLGGKFYVTDFANNLYSLDPTTGTATLIGPTGMPPLTFAPATTNPDGTLNVYSENMVSARGKLYANFATVVLDFSAGTFTPVIQGALYEIDPVTGLATWIALTDPNITAMVNVNDTVLAFDAWTGQVLTLDLTTGQTTPVSEIDAAAGSLIPGATPARPFPAAGR